SYRRWNSGDPRTSAASLATSVFAGPRSSWLRRVISGLVSCAARTARVSALVWPATSTASSRSSTASGDRGSAPATSAPGSTVTRGYRPLASGRYPRVTVDPGALVAGADPRSPDAVLDRLLAVLVAGQTSAETRAVLAAQLTNPEITRLSHDDRGPANTDVAKLAALVLGSPEF